MKKGICALVMAVAMALAPNVYAQSATLSLDVDGQSRSYVLHSPSGYNPGKHYPLMVVFHGTNGRGAGMERMTGFDAVADQYGFFVAYPDSVDAKWKMTGSENDITFSQAMIEAIERSYSIDPTRIYVSGLSQGGGMAQAFTCLNTDKVAGVAVIAENLNRHFESLCHPSRPVSMVLFHGTADPVSPYGGGSNYTGAATGSAQQTAEFWSQANGCAATPSSSRFDNSLSDGSSQPGTLQVWGGCQNGVTVSFYTIPGGGHTWPGGSVKNKDLGAVSLSLNASQVIWQTLSAHHN